MLNCLEVADAMPERAPLRGVLSRNLVAGLRDPECLRRNADTPTVEGPHGDAETAVLLVEQPVSTDPRALDDDVVRRGRVEAELLLVPGHTHVFRVEDERAHTPGPCDLGIGACKQDERPRVPAVRNPLLRPGDRPAVTGGFGLRAERAGVGTGLGFGECERTQLLAACQGRHETGLLLVGPVRQEG